MVVRSLFHFINRLNKIKKKSRKWKVFSSLVAHSEHQYTRHVHFGLHLSLRAFTYFIFILYYFHLIFGISF